MTVTGSSLNIEVVQGNSKNIDFNVQGDGIGPVNLDNIEDIVWTCARSLANPGALLTKTLETGGIEIIDSDAGIFRVKLDPEDTVNFPPGEYLHEALLIDGTGTELTVVDVKDAPGIFRIRQRIAQAPA